MDAKTALDVAKELKLNQNLWALIVSALCLGIAEFFELHTLYWVGIVLIILTTLSLIFSLTFYTLQYCAHKFSIFEIERYETRNRIK